MKVLGALVVTSDSGTDGIRYVPMDGGEGEFVPLDRCPAVVVQMVSDLSDANGATPLGVIVELG